MSIAEKFYTMEYGAAPEDPKEATSGSIGIIADSRIHRRRVGRAGSRRIHFNGRSIDGDTLAEVAQGNPADVDAAVSAARKALPGVAGAQRP